MKSQNIAAQKYINAPNDIELVYFTCYVIFFSDVNESCDTVNPLWK